MQHAKAYHAKQPITSYWSYKMNARLSYLDFQKTLPEVPNPGFPPEHAVNFANGILDRSTRTLYAHTPRCWSQNILDYDYDVAAACPAWLNFLGETAQGETDWLDALQMWFGYNLVPDTTQQKLLLLVGPPRSGKGTVCRVMAKVFGQHNVCSPALSFFESSFGLSPLLGKLSAICPDAHIGRSSDSVKVLERLKSIVGEDQQQVDRKFKDPITAKLNVRFTITVNELMSFPDASGAMASRLIVLPFRVSHTGKEDIYLGQRLALEAPGIANWALDGLDLLVKTGRLIQPASGVAILQDFGRLSAPIRCFVEDWCEYPAYGKTITCDQLRHAWNLWCEEFGHEPGNDSRFKEKLRASGVNVDRVQTRNGEKREWYYQSICLNPTGLERLMEASQQQGKSL